MTDNSSPSVVTDNSSSSATTNEVFAHISASATPQADDLYQALATAYRDFEPHKSPRDQDDSGSGLREPLKASASPRDVNSDIAPNPVSKDWYGSFPSYLSSQDHVDPFIQGASQVDEDWAGYGSIPTPSRLLRLECMHRIWRQNGTPRSCSVNSAKSAQQPLQGPANTADTTLIEDTQEAMQGLQSQLNIIDPTTLEDTSDCESDLESERFTAVFQASDIHNDLPHTGNQEVEIPSSALTPVHLSINILTPAPLDLEASEKAITSPMPSSALVEVHSNVSANTEPTVKALKSRRFPDFPVSVLPPPPSVSTGQYRRLPSQITTYLAAIKSRHPTRFKLIAKKYTLKKYDRGYWVLDCASWPGKAQLELWSEMQRHVRSGKLGWGTTLHRVSYSPKTVGQFRLYCWAEVAEHIWLQLWLSSGGRLARNPVKWYDADGVVVLEAVLGPKRKQLESSSKS